MDNFKTYVLTYRHDGAEWTLELPAKSWDDARRRINSLCFARIDGELVQRIPASVGWFVPLVVWIRNTFCGARKP